MDITVVSLVSVKYGHNALNHIRLGLRTQLSCPYFPETKNTITVSTHTERLVKVRSSAVNYRLCNQ